MKLSSLLVDTKITKSKAEAKRLLRDGAVEINGEKITVDAEVVFVKND